MAVEDGVLTTNPALRVKVRVPQVKQAVLSASEIEILLREAKVVRHRFYEVWALAILTGMRSGELFALTWQNVDFDGGKILVSQSWSSKNGIGPTKTAKNRIVPMSLELRKFLKELSLTLHRGQPVRVIMTQDHYLSLLGKIAAFENSTGQKTVPHKSANELAQRVSEAAEHILNHDERPRKKSVANG